MMSRDFVGALLQLNAEKQVPQQALIRAVEEGIQAAYRRVAGEEDIFVRIEPGSGEIRVYRGRHVVDEIEDETVEVTVAEARKTHPEAHAGEVIEIEQLDAEHFGRIGAQTAKQIILQRMREVERDQRFDTLAAREGELITGSVSRVEPRAIILDVGKGDEAVLQTSEQSPLEHYRIGQPVKAFVLEVRRSARGPQVMVSRTHKGFLRRLFELEVPEIHAGTVEIKAIAREAGSRSKVAVSSRQDGLDPVGATVGQRGARVQAVVAELAGEKIDVIPWNEDASVFVANALSPAQVLGVAIDEEHRIANVTVPERMLSLAIGREGQNARLAARLTGWRIDIRSDVAVAEAAAAAERAAAAPAITEPEPEPEAVDAPVVAVVADGAVAAPAGTEASDEVAPDAATDPAPAAEPGAEPTEEPEAATKAAELDAEAVAPAPAATLDADPAAEPAAEPAAPAKPAKAPAKRSRKQSSEEVSS
jgi:transcription termination/antitermination protein NusA